MSASLRPICVFGAGTMGRGIVQVALGAGHAVLLVDPDEAQLQGAHDEVLARLAKKDPALGESARQRLTMAVAVSELPPAEGAVVIEAVVERLEVKAEVFRAAYAHFGPTCILATNTSSLSVTEIAAATEAPERVVGMHFFNPVPLMRLVEVVYALQSDAAIVDVIADLARSWGKDVAMVRNAPGFIVNRVARAFYGEALRLVEEGAAPPETIDELMRSAGQFRMGPFELMDLIGVEVNNQVTKTVWAAYNFDPRFAPSRLQGELVAAGKFGRKSGVGFYDYRGGIEKTSAEPIAVHGDVPAALLVDGHDHQLRVLLNRAGIRPGSGHTDGPGRIYLPDLGHIVVTQGRTAESESRALGNPAVVLDRCMDPSTTTALAVAGSSEALVDATAALLDAAGIRAFRVQDTPGLVVARILSMIANEAFEATLQGVASPADIDIAMLKGTNYPSGPFEWTESWGSQTVLNILDGVWADYRDPRYRASTALRQAAVA